MNVFQEWLQFLVALPLFPTLYKGTMTYYKTMHRNSTERRCCVYGSFNHDKYYSVIAMLQANVLAQRQREELLGSARRDR